MLEQRPRQPRLPDDRHECPEPDLGVVGHRHRHGGLLRAFLHDDVAASLANLKKTVLLQEGA